MTHNYGSTPDEYMMYLLKQEMGEDQNTLPVLDLFRYLRVYIYRGNDNSINNLCGPTIKLKIKIKIKC